MDRQRKSAYSIDIDSAAYASWSCRLFERAGRGVANRVSRHASLRLAPDPDKRRKCSAESPQIIWLGVSASRPIFCRLLVRLFFISLLCARSDQFRLLPGRARWRRRPTGCGAGPQMRRRRTTTQRGRLHCGGRRSRGPEAAPRGGHIVATLFVLERPRLNPQVVSGGLFRRTS